MLLVCLQSSVISWKLEVRPLSTQLPLNAALSGPQGHSATCWRCTRACEPGEPAVPSPHTPWAPLTPLAPTTPGCRQVPETAAAPSCPPVPVGSRVPALQGEGVTPGALLCGHAGRGWALIRTKDCCPYLRGETGRRSTEAATSGRGQGSERWSEKTSRPPPGQSWRRQEGSSPGGFSEHGTAGPSTLDLCPPEPRELLWATQCAALC